MDYAAYKGYNVVDVYTENISGAKKNGKGGAMMLKTLFYHIFIVRMNSFLIFLVTLHPCNVHMTRRALFTSSTKCPISQ